MALMSNDNIQVPTELWLKIWRFNFNAHPVADMIRKLKDEIDPDDYIQSAPSVFNPDDFVGNLNIELFKYCYTYHLIISIVPDSSSPSEPHHDMMLTILWWLT